jgi:spore germination protein GerM
MINQSEDLEEVVRAIIEDLIKGPGGNLIRTIPQGTSLNAVYVSHDGTAYVDFSEALRENHPGGSQTELLTVYSIVNSLALNIPQVNRVKILIDGREIMTIAGHIDSRFPFKANMMLLR